MLDVDFITLLELHGAFLRPKRASEQNITDSGNAPTKGKFNTFDLSEAISPSLQHLTVQACNSQMSNHLEDMFSPSKANHHHLKTVQVGGASTLYTAVTHRSSLFCFCDLNTTDV